MANFAILERALQTEVEGEKWVSKSSMQSIDTLKVPRHLAGGVHEGMPTGA